MIDRISAEWISLCEEGASNQPFLRPEWFQAFVGNFENEIDLLTVRRDGKLRAILPLVRKRATLHALPARKLQAVFSLNTPRFDLIHGNDESERNAVTNAIWKVISEQKKWDVVEMRLVKSDSWLADILKIAERENHLTGVWPMDSAPYIDLPQGEDKESIVANYFKGSRKHFRQELDRRLRRLKELGTVQFVVTPDFNPELLTTYLELEEKGWKGRGGTAVKNDSRVVRLHEQFTEGLAAGRSVFVYQLKLDGKTIAMSINISYGKEMIHWKTSYDEEYSRYSPGNILFRELLSDCIRNGTSEIDFLSPSTPNKRVWASGEREHAAFYVFQRSLLGSILHKWKFVFINALRGLKSDVPGKLVPIHAEK